MRIESLRTTPDRAGRDWVTFCDGTKMGLYRQTVEDFGLYSGMELEDEEYERLQTAAGEMSAKMRAIRILSASNVSKRDLQQRLVHKGEDPEQARKAIEWMEDLDLLDDRKTAQWIVEKCIAKGYGLARAKQALYEKQIPKSLWDEVLADYPDQTDRIVDLLRSKLGDEWDQKDLKRAIDAAMRRGHSYHEIRRALQILQADDDFPEEF